MNIISIEAALSLGVSPNTLLDIADWHVAKADDLAKRGDHAGAARHHDIEDRLCVRADQVRRAAMIARAA